MNEPGSTHDATAAYQLYEKLRATPLPFHLLADVAFPRTGDMKGKIKVPLKRDARLPQSGHRKAALLQYNKSLVQARQAAEWGMRGLQGCFSRLKVPLPVDAQDRFLILKVVVRLYQVRTRRLGINQIREVFLPTWSQRSSLDDFADLMFGDIRKSDRVSKFYNIM